MSTAIDERSPAGQRMIVSRFEELPLSLSHFRSVDNPSQPIATSIACRALTSSPTKGIIMKLLTGRKNHTSRPSTSRLKKAVVIGVLASCLGTGLATAHAADPVNTTQTYPIRNSRWSPGPKVSNPLKYNIYQNLHNLKVEVPPWAGVESFVIAAVNGSDISYSVRPLACFNVGNPGWQDTGWEIEDNKQTKIIFYGTQNCVARFGHILQADTETPAHDNLQNYWFHYPDYDL